MSASSNTLASLAAGFALGIGFFTVWEAIKQTRRNQNPKKSLYIYMIWGEIMANIGIGVMGWLLLEGILTADVPVLFVLLVFYVFEIQLLMQIIVNRIAIIAETRETVTRVKWATAGVITAINIAVFCIWIPAHRDPPVSVLFVQINRIWDRISKSLICLVDAWLNWFFLKNVRVRLVQQAGLLKYQPLVDFNTKLMVLSVLSDVMLIGLMSLPNENAYIQFHPVVYTAKLNIEMSMASLIRRLKIRQQSGIDLHQADDSPAFCIKVGQQL
ncbi:hypothetical protein N0V93_009657 [Gnomoniopsis smithogilvyi]|uniref:Uncharacterized protein n=1 Tax=Gnomoniopsis smithogilvyi TaxID=1191159 RepID=A0A9W9CU01_9PEZI|nr:hypothetical protein N0V93_009657 [Gnomoniopsis smithogilvyi]